jgi:hypothetical protein
VEVVDMNILLENTINKEIQEYYEKMDVIQWDINRAYINEDTKERILFEKKLADLVRNTYSIWKYRKTH